MLTIKSLAFINYKSNNLLIRSVNKITNSFYKITNVSDQQDNTKEKLARATTLKEISGNKLGDYVKVQGWIQSVRKMKKAYFFDLNDGSNCEKVQIVVSKSDVDIPPSVGQSVEIIGSLAETPKKQLEIHASEMKLIGDCNISDGGYPFTPKQTHYPEYVREYLHMRSRVDYMRSIFRVRHRVCKILHDFMDENNFIQINTPILTANDCEGAGEIFQAHPDNFDLLKNMTKLDIPIEESYFDQKAFLSVSGQLHLEAMCHGLGNTYTFLPAFRAENSKSPLHLSEFYMFEAELAFCDNIETLINFIEKMLKIITQRVLDNCMEDVQLYSSIFDTQEDLNFDWLTKKWNTLTFDEAFTILESNKDKLQTNLKKDDGFSKEQEMFLVNLLQTPVFVIEWPKSMKPFYMQEVHNDSAKVSGLDLLMPRVGELVGGSLRENNYKLLKASIPKGLEWYLDLRKYGSIPTGGFGLGFERYLQLITGVKNIRDVIPFPRYPHSCKI